MWDSLCVPTHNSTSPALETGFITEECTGPQGQSMCWSTYIATLSSLCQISLVGVQYIAVRDEESQSGSTTISHLPPEAQAMLILF